jgi:hypothetical protein
VNHPSFVVYHWEKPDFQQPDLRDAYALLEKGDAPQDQRDEAFRTLLKSNVDIAQGIVFDIFFYWQTLDRWAIKNPYLKFSSLLADAARAQLRKPPVTSGHVTGANHASALGVLAHLGKIEDLALIEPVLRASRDINVLEAGLFALILDDLDDIPARLVETLADIIGDETIDEGIRQGAIGTFRNVRRLPPPIETLCIHLIDGYSPVDSRLPAEAALTLACTDLPRHRAFLTQRIDSWPPDSLYPASEIRDLLEEAD